MKRTALILVSLFVVSVCSYAQNDIDPSPAPPPPPPLCQAIAPSDEVQSVYQHNPRVVQGRWRQRAHLILRPGNKRTEHYSPGNKSDTGKFGIK
jgi:hypothetical protein